MVEHINIYSAYGDIEGWGLNRVNGDDGLKVW